MVHSNKEASSDLAEQEEFEYQRGVGPKPTTFGGKVKRHCARFWWIHLIIFCIIFLIIALCLVYVAMPKIAQSGVNRSSLEINTLQFTNPTSNSITLTQNGILHSPSMYTPTLDPFNASSYLVENGTYATKPMVIIPMPKIHAKHPQGNVSVTNQVLQILDLDMLSAYTTAALSQEYVTTALVGETKLHEGALPVTTVKYNQTSTYKGLNGLKGFNVTGISINLDAKSGEPNMSGYAYIPNPSGISFEMGNVTLSLSTSTGVVGNTTINNMSIVPGNNTLPLTGILDQTKVLSSMDLSGVVVLGIRGESVLRDGEHLVYYEKALSSTQLSLSLNVKQILANSLTSSLTTLSL